MENNKVQQDLASIRQLMERSSKFISLSGLSGILAGVYALAGAGFAYSILNNSGAANTSFEMNGSSSQATGYIFTIVIIVLMASIATGLVFSARKARKNGQQLWGPTSRLLLYNMAVPLFAGGALIMILISKGNMDMLIPVSLIFYGLALTGASNYTFTDIKYLGLCEIVLGIIAAIYPAVGLLLWATGFGLLHVIYGSMMYLKYDR